MRKNFRQLWCTVLVSTLLSGCSWFGFSGPRVDDRDNPHPEHLVQTGDVIEIPRAMLREHTKSIQWSQDGVDMMDEYFVMKGIFRNPRLPDAMPTQVPLFVQSSFIEDFEAECRADAAAKLNACMMPVTSKLRYGQNAEKTMRFLVFHDPNYEPFQHRFIDTDTLAILTKVSYRTVDSVLDHTEDLIPYGSLIKKAGAASAELMSASVGDQLWLFEDAQP